MKNQIKIKRLVISEPFGTVLLLQITNNKETKLSR